MIRKATITDIPELLEMGKKFHAASGQPFEFNEDAVGSLLIDMMLLPDGVVFRSDAGLVGGKIAPAYCDPDWRVAIELFWWAEDRQGLKLLRAFEAWAKDNEANEVRMTTLPALPSADAIVRRFGYEPSEISYSRLM